MQYQHCQPCENFLNISPSSILFTISGIIIYQQFSHLFPLTQYQMHWTTYKLCNTFETTGSSNRCIALCIAVQKLWKI